MNKHRTRRVKMSRKKTYRKNLENEMAYHEVFYDKRGKPVHVSYEGVIDEINSSNDEVSELIEQVLKVKKRLREDATY
jgi:hypothetical protein